MRWCAVAVVFLALALAVLGCGPGRGTSRRKVTRRLPPLVYKQHLPNVPEHTLTASGLTEGRVDRNDSRFINLEPNYNNDIIFKDEEGTGADRLMTGRCKEKLNTLAISVMNQWPGVKLVVTEGWDEQGDHSPDSLHYEGRAVDIMTSDRERSKLGMLARLAVEAGFDWVQYKSRTHIHCSVKSESSQSAKYGGCFTGDSTVLTSTGIRRPLSNLQVGEQILALDPSTKKLVFSEVILFLDYNPSQKRDFLELKLSTGRTLTVTPNHLVVLKDGRTVYAEKLKIGDKLLVNDNKHLSEDTIVQITLVARSGVFAPLTEVGTVVVNDVVASCYATVDSQNLAHWSFLPLRLIWNFKLGMQRAWTIINNPLNGWSIEISDVNKEKPPMGIHWYAKILYSTASYLIPTHLYD